MEALLRNDVMQNSLCDKLWRRELFAGIRFPEGRTYEDIAVLHRPFERAAGVICVPRAFYHYVQRPDGITGTKTLENRINHYRAAELRLRETGDRWPQFRPLLEAQCAASAVTVWCGYYSNPRRERERWSGQLKEMARMAGGRCPLALRHLGIGAAGRLVVRLTPYAAWWSFALAGVVGRLYEIRHGRML